MVRKKIAYIATPYKHYIDNGDGVEVALNVARQYASYAKEAGYIPLSPVLAFNEIFDELKEREIALECCFKLMEKCDVFLYDDFLLSISDGMRQELEFARMYGLQIVEIDNAR